MEEPKREDVECLCKLMSTVGGQLDTGSQKGHELMDAYFHRIGRLATSDKLESRLRFLLRVRILALVMGLLRLLLRAGSVCNCLKYA